MFPVSYFIEAFCKPSRVKINVTKGIDLKKLFFYKPKVHQFLIQIVINNSRYPQLVFFHNIPCNILCVWYQHSWWFHHVLIHTALLSVIPLYCKLQISTYWWFWYYSLTVTTIPVSSVLTTISWKQEHLSERESTAREVQRHPEHAKPSSALPLVVGVNLRMRNQDKAVITKGLEIWKVLPPAGESYEQDWTRICLIDRRQDVIQKGGVYWAWLTATWVCGLCSMNDWKSVVLNTTRTT